jgi:hypothetical protein
VARTENDVADMGQRSQRLILLVKLVVKYTGVEKLFNKSTMFWYISTPSPLIKSRNVQKALRDFDFMELTVPFHLSASLDVAQFWVVYV